MNITNLTAHLLEQDISPQTHALVDVINRLVLAGKIISRDINKAGLADVLGSTGTFNVQAEEQQKLDAYSNDLFVEVLRQSPFVAAVGTEENEEMVFFDDDRSQKHGLYNVFVDPIDGSSNIDVNVSVGTIFVIFKKDLSGGKSQKPESNYLQSGQKVVAAGYIVYGASTMLVYSIGKGVDGFTLDPSIGEFLLSHPQIKYPAQNTIYSINESYEPLWDKALKDYILQLKKQEKPPTARYIGSLVSDFHRNLLKGGIYLYPADKKSPNGKLRLMYEGIPFAYLAKQAGGRASDGNQDILDIEPTKLHQRTPLFIGPSHEVSAVEAKLKN